MGFQETRELKAALDGFAQRDDVNKDSFAIWGANLGAYAALAVAEKTPSVRALILESVYNRPTDFLRLQVSRSGLSHLPWLQSMTTFAFDFEHREDRKFPPDTTGLGATKGVFKLFLESPDEQELAVSTHVLFMRAPEPKQEAVLAQGNYAGMPDDAEARIRESDFEFLVAEFAGESGRSWEIKDSGSDSARCCGSECERATRLEQFAERECIPFRGGEYPGSPRRW